MSQADEVGQLWEQLRQKDAQILMLQKKLSHFRSWLGSVNSRVQQMNPSAVRNARKLYIGGVPADTTDEELRHFFNGLMLRSGALTSPGSAILSCRINHDKSYAFIEFRSVEEASNAMALDGIRFKDIYLKIRRPSNYDLNTAIMLGPVLADPTMDTTGLDMCRAVVEDSPSKLFIGGLQCDWSEDEVKNLLAPYGALKSFNLVMDKVTGKSKGYAFCEFVEESVTDYVVKSLHNKKHGSKVLTVKRALEGALARQQAAAQAASGSQGPSGSQPPASPMGAADRAQQQQMSHTTPQSSRPPPAPGHYPSSHQTSISPNSMPSSMQTSPAQSNNSPAGAVPQTPSGIQPYGYNPATPATAAAGQTYHGQTPPAVAAATTGPTNSPALFQRQQPAQPATTPVSAAYPAGPASYYAGQGQAAGNPGFGGSAAGSAGGYGSGTGSGVSSSRSSAGGAAAPGAYQQMSGQQGGPLTGYGNSVMGNLW